MKLKGLNKRAHNIMFHTHTVTGITLSAALYVIFYCGAFSLFREEIKHWENRKIQETELTPITDAQKLLDVAFDAAGEIDHNKSFTFHFPTEANPYVKFYCYPQKDENGKQEMAHYLINPRTKEAVQYEWEGTKVADTIYRLHYFRQIPYIGRYLSGLVSVFFLFAIVTGVLIHWKNMVQKFYAFSFKRKLKTIWKDAHVLLSMFGLPFQVIYAISGTLFGLLTLLLAPTAFITFNGDTDPLFGNLNPQNIIKVKQDAPPAEMLSLNHFIDDINQNYEVNKIRHISVKNYGMEGANIQFMLDDEIGLTGDGYVLYDLITGEKLKDIPPYKKTYAQSVYNTILRLHFASYGSWWLRVVYFILALLTCFALISGLLIWQTARDTKTYTEKQKRFHFKVTRFFLALCLSLFPAIPFLFVMNRLLLPRGFEVQAKIEESSFFIFWLLLTIAGLFWNNLRKLNFRYLLLGGIMACCVPLVNGFITGEWLWNSLSNHRYHIFSIDFCWLLTGITALTAWWFFGREKRVKKEGKIA